jgi:predicted PurR-regulated permease PerM
MSEKGRKSGPPPGARTILVNGEPLHIVIERAPFPWRKIFIALAVVAGLYLLGVALERLHEVVIMLVVAGLVAFILEPLVMALEKKMPRWSAIAVSYLGLILLLSLAALQIIPKIVEQVGQLTQNMPRIQAQIHEYTDRVNAYRDKIPEQLRDQIQGAQNSLQGWSKEMLAAFGAVMLAGLGWMGKGMIILVLSIYLLLDKDRIRDGLLALVPIPARAETLSVVGDVLVVLRSYLRGQIVVIGFVAVSVTAALLLLEMPYALTVGCLAGFLEIIPYFGAVVGAIPGVLYAFFVKGMGWGIGMICFFITINQVEGHVVIPLVMGANLEMRPLTVLLSLLVGHSLGGIVGLIVAVPVCRILQVFVEHGVQIYKDLRGLNAALKESDAARGARTEGAVEEPSSKGSVAAGQLDPEAARPAPADVTASADPTPAHSTAAESAQTDPAPPVGTVVEVGAAEA